MPCDVAQRGAHGAGRRLSWLTLYPLLRVLGCFGNLRMPAGQSLIDFFNAVKYPPSLTFLLLSLGFDLVLLSLFARAAPWLSTVARPLVTLGHAAPYFFLVHWFVYAAMGSIFPDARCPAGHLPDLDPWPGGVNTDLQDP